MQRFSEFDFSLWKWRKRGVTNLSAYTTCSGVFTFGKVNFISRECVFVRKISVLFLMMLFCFALPVTAQASLFAGGDGTAGNPFIITTAAQLDAVRTYSGAAGTGVHFRLGNNIDLTGYRADELDWAMFGWLPINDFRGVFDGNRHVISGLWINRNTTNNIGLFGTTHDATISNLGVVIPINVIGNGNVGGLVGSAGRNTTIINTFVVGNVTGNGNNVGGLVGNLYGGSVTNSYTTGNVNGANGIGGLVGVLGGQGNITNSFATGNVSGNNSVGGLLGGRGSFGGSVANSFATGNVNGTGNNIGALIGAVMITITNSHRYQFATVNGAVVPAADTDSAPNRSHGGVLTASQLMTQATYTSTLHWVFSDITWRWDHRGFPMLGIGTENWPFPFPAGGGIVHHTVSFNSMGGTPVAPQTVISGSTIVRPVNPTREGFAFAGWYIEAATINAWNFATGIVTGDITLFARWTPGGGQPGQDIPLTSVSINTGAQVGGVRTLTHTKTPSNANGTFTYAWHSSDTRLATITPNGGQATVRAGTHSGIVTITLTVTQTMPSGATRTVSNFVQFNVTGGGGTGARSDSGGCNAGFGLLALMLVLPLVTAVRRRK